MKSCVIGSSLRFGKCVKLLLISTSSIALLCSGLPCSVLMDSGAMYCAIVYCTSAGAGTSAGTVTGGPTGADTVNSVGTGTGASAI